MAAKKMEGRLDTVEEEVAEVRGKVQKKMESVRSELQCLVPLEKSVEMLLGRMLVLDHMDRWLQKVKGSDPSGSSSGVIVTPSVPKVLASSVPEVLDRGNGVVPTASNSPSAAISMRGGGGTLATGRGGTLVTSSEEATRSE